MSSTRSSVQTSKTHLYTVRFLPAVWLLQAPHQLRLHLRRRHGLDAGGHQLDGPGLPGLEQPVALLQLPVVQGRRGGHGEAGLEAHRRRLHRLPRLHYHHLLRRLLRLQEQPQGQRLPRRVEGRIRLIIPPPSFGVGAELGLGRPPCVTMLHAQCSAPPCLVVALSDSRRRTCLLGSM